MGEGYNKKIKRYSLSLAMAEDLTCQSIKNSKADILGPPGTGKSECALSVCCGGAKHVSIIKYREPDRWEEFFPYEENIAIVLVEEMIALAEKKGPEGTMKLFDEVQIEANNSRDYNSQVNRLMNLLYILYRPSRHGIVSTYQQLIMKDRQSRYNSDYYVEMLPMRSEKYGVNFCKVKIGSQKSLEESDLMHYYYPIINGIQYPLCATFLADKKVRKVYLKRRNENQKIASERKKDEIEREKEIKKIKEDKVLNGGGPSELELKIQSALIDNPRLSGGALAKMFDCSEGHARSIKRKLHFS
jgi:hypothetical protein